VFTGTLFSAFGVFWLAYFANVSYFLKQVPSAQAGHALGLFLCGFAIYTVVMSLASFSTDKVASVALTFLLLTISALGAGNYWARTCLIHWGGYLALATAALAGYLAAAGISEASYGRASCRPCRTRRASDRRSPREESRRHMLLSALSKRTERA
jgi:succinate-acetate transporter protein